MRLKKTVEAEHVERLAKYFARKIADESLEDLLEDSGSQAAAVKALEKVLRTPNAANLQQWFDLYLSSEARKKVWNALRNAPYRGRTPRTNRELKKAVFNRVMAWAEQNEITELNDAVIALLEKASKRRS
jgi:hypothetical protein